MNKVKEALDLLTGENEVWDYTTAINKAAVLLQQHLDDDGWVREKYNELLMAVERKWPGENIHETALRYIQQYEKQTSCEVESVTHSDPPKGE